MTPIEDFLIKNIEGYLFKDLKSMSEIPVKDFGSCSYPMVMTTLAGMELLGYLIGAEPFDYARGENYFMAYWEEVLSKYKTSYKDHGSVFRRLVRHGLMHTFLTKANIDVYRERPEAHLMYSNDQQTHLMIDAGSFYIDFKASYEARIDPILRGEDTLNGVTKTTMQARLNELEDVYIKDTETNMKRFLHFEPSSLTPATGASTSFTRNNGGTASTFTTTTPFR